MSDKYLDQIPDAEDVQFEFGRKAYNRKPKNNIIYCRESDDRLDRGIRISDQETQCRRVAETNNLNVSGIIREERTARRPGRPKFDNLIKALKEEEPLDPKYVDELSSAKVRPDGIIAWHPDRLSRNWKDSAEIIELLDSEILIDMNFVIYSFHNDASGKEHLAMEFARAKGYSDHLQNNVLRGTMAKELKGKGMHPLPPAFTVHREDNATHSDHLKIIPSDLHKHWRNAYRWKLDGMNDEDIAHSLVHDYGYKHRYKYKGQMRTAIVTGSYVGSHLRNPLHFGWLVVQNKKKGEKKEERKVDLVKVFPEVYGEDFPIVVTKEEFQRIYPNMFSDTANKPPAGRQKRKYPLSSDKVLCKCRHDKGMLATMTPSRPIGGSGKPSPRFSCQRCKPNHSVQFDDVYSAIGKALKGVKCTEREHKQMVVTYWHDYEDERSAIENSKRSIRTIKKNNEQELHEAELVLNNMKYGTKKASQKETQIQERHVKNLQEEAISLDDREANLTKQSIEEYNTLDAFLELTKNGFNWWKKADDDQKKKMADLLVSHVIVDGNKVDQIILSEPFKSWSERKKSGKSCDGRDGRT